MVNVCTTPNGATCPVQPHAVGCGGGSTPRVGRHPPAAPSRLVCTLATAVPGRHRAAPGQKWHPQGFSCHIGWPNFLGELAPPVSTFSPPDLCFNCGTQDRVKPPNPWPIVINHSQSHLMKNLDTNHQEFARSSVCPHILIKPLPSLNAQSHNLVPVPGF